MSPPRSNGGPAPRGVARRRRAAPRPRAVAAMDEADATILDLVDNLLNKGVVINAELVLAIADVDLVYLRLSALLCAADRVLGGLLEGTKTR